MDIEQGRAAAGKVEEMEILVGASDSRTRSPLFRLLEWVDGLSVVGKVCIIVVCMLPLGLLASGLPNPLALVMYEAESGPLCFSRHERRWVPCGIRADPCPSEMAACEAEDGCVDDLHAALNALAPPTEGSNELMAVIECLKEVSMG